MVTPAAANLKKIKYKELTWNISFFLGRERVTHSMPILITTGIILYVDRILRQEIIFDSSALTCTVFVVHVLNICRSRIAHIDEHNTMQHALASMQNNNTLSTVPVLEIAGSMETGMHGMCLGIYSLCSILLLLDFDPTSILDSNGSVFSNPMMMSVSTIVLNCLFVGLTMQIPISEGTFMLPWKIMVRSFLFVMLSIFWTYCIGIHDSSIMMSTRSYPYYYNPVLKKKFVQPFTPCQLRFLVVLFTDGWLLVFTGTSMLIIMSKHLSNLVQVVSSSSYSYSDIEAADACGFHENGEQGNENKDLSAAEDGHTVNAEDTGHTSRHHEDTQKISSTDRMSSDNDVLAMFRLAQKASSGSGR